MLIMLSMDTWRDVFDFLGLKDRKELALKCNGIGDRQFNDICQKWLHEWTKRVRLGPIRVIKSPPSKKPWNIETSLLECYTDAYYWKEAPFAVEELPANIKDFESIQISHLSTNVLQLLRLMQPIFNDVNLHIHCSDDAKSLGRTRIVLSHLMPFFTNGIECLDLTIYSCHLLFAIRDRFPAQFLSIKKLEIFDISETDLTIDLIELLLRWLGNRREDGEPRMLWLGFFCGNPMEFIARIRQRFHDAISSAKFFVRISADGWMTEAFNVIQESTAENAGTNEQLLVRKPAAKVLLIGRCPSEMDGQKWVEEMGKQIVEAYRQTAPRKIMVSYPTLGPMEEAKSEEMEEENEDGKDLDQQPGPSSKQ